MNELIALMLALGAILLVVTLVGHGIWVVLAAIFRKLGAPSQQKLPTRPTSRSCPRCNHRLELDPNHCRECNWPLPASEPASAIALRALQRQLQTFASRGAIDEETYAGLAAAIDQQQKRLLPIAAPALAPAAADASQDGDGEQAEVIPLTPVEPTPPRATSETPVGERARRYATSRRIAATQPLAEQARPAPPKKREALSRLLAAFMEEKNIRWGELVGGMLIVGCSLALVISFWSEIASRPLFKFVLLNGVTAALFGIGLYTDRRWKIHTTSHGILIIASLLVPLNFLAIAAFTHASPPTDLLGLAGEAVSLVVFALLVYAAGRILLPDDALLLTIGVMLPSLMQLVVRRFASPSSSIATILLLGAVPVVVYLATMLRALRRRRATELTAVDARRVLTLLGLTSAAGIIPLALLHFSVPPVQETLHRLSPLGELLGLPALATGILFWLRFGERENSALQTAGIAIGALGGFVMVAFVAYAWPDPATLLPTLAVLAGTMFLVAVAFAVPPAHLPAVLALAAAIVIGFYLLRGDVAWTLLSPVPMSRVLLSATSGHLLALGAPLVAGIGWWLSKREASPEQGTDAPQSASAMYYLASVILAVSGLALLLWFGFARPGDPSNIVWTIGLYGAAAMAVAIRFHQVPVAYVGSGLVLAALVQTIVYRYGVAWNLDRPFSCALLAHASIVVLLITLLRRRQAALRSAAAIALWQTALLTSIAATVLIVGGALTSPPAATSIYLAWLAVVWMLASAIRHAPALFTASQAALVPALFAAVTAALQSRAWYQAAANPWLDPWFLQVTGIALAGYCLAIEITRRRIAHSDERQNENTVEQPSSDWRQRALQLLNPEWPAVDRVVEIAVVVLLLWVAFYAATPGVAQELSPRAGAVRVVPPVEQFEIARIDHRHASGPGAWLLLGATGAMLVARWHPSTVHARGAGIVLALFCTCPLLAAHWGSEVAVASALRWISAAFLVIVSVAVWKRWPQPLFQVPAAGHMASDVPMAHPPHRLLRDVVVALVALLYVLIGAYVCQAVLNRAGLPRQIQQLVPWVLIWAAIATILGLAVAPIMHRRQPLTPRASPAADGAFCTNHLRTVLLLLAVAPFVVLMIFSIASALQQFPLVGPEPNSWFRRIGWDVSYGVPLATIALVLVGYAIRDRSSAYAFSAGLLLNIVTTIVVVLRLARGAASLETAAWILVAQANAIVAALVALVWIAACFVQSRREPRAANGSYLAAPPLLQTQLGLAAALCALFLLPATANLVVQMRPADWAIAADGPLGWTAIALTTLAFVWLNRRTPVSHAAVAGLAAAFVPLVALTAAHWDNGDWLAYHTLLAGSTAAAWLVPITVWFASRRNASAAGPLVGTAPQLPAFERDWSASTLFGLTSVLLAFWAYDADPESPWWTVGALVAIAVRNLWIAWLDRLRTRVWIAAVLFIPAVSMLWFDWGHQFTATRGFGQFFEYVWIVTVALGAVALASVAIESRRIALQPAPHEVRRTIAFHRFAAWTIVALLMMATAVRLLADVSSNPIDGSMPLAWVAWLAALVTAAACLWDPAIRWPVACLYLVGLIAVGVYVDALDLQAPLFQFAFASALAGFSLATSGFWSVRERVTSWARHFGIPVRSSILSAGLWQGGAHAWLVPANIALGCIVLCLVFWIQQSSPSFPQRMVSAYAVGAQAFAIGLLARGAVRSALQYLALVWGVFFAVAFGWAWLPPGFAAPWLHRLVIAATALALVIVIYAFGLVKFLRRENEWTRAAMRLVPALAGINAVLILVVVAVEALYYWQRGAVPIAPAALVAVALGLAGLAAAALVAAIVPGRDPFDLSPRARTAYVYAAEVLLALLFVHIRVTMDWLFRGWFLQFWPLIVMVLAFVGVGFGELFQRRRQHVLAEPLQKTGALLPLLPAIGFWALPNEVHYSLLLLSISLLYAGLAILRRSFVFGILAAIAANGSLWYLLHEFEGLSLGQHPQLWLIPPALSALVAGYINRHRLTQQQMTTLRLACAIVIYVSSTADVFIHGVGAAPWLPAVLAALSILGVLAGILLRVRAFLYLGTAFLFVALLTVIWHAAIHERHTWILWVAGIVTGILIIALFGIFEKRRHDVLRLIEQLKQWQP